MTASVLLDSIQQNESNEKSHADARIKHETCLFKYSFAFPFEQQKNVQYDTQDDQKLKSHTDPTKVCRVRERTDKPCKSVQ